MHFNYAFYQKSRYDNFNQLVGTLNCTFHISREEPACVWIRARLGRASCQTSSHSSSCCTRKDFLLYKFADIPYEIARISGLIILFIFTMSVN